MAPPSLSTRKRLKHEKIVSDCKAKIKEHKKEIAKAKVTRDRSLKKLGLASSLAASAPAPSASASIALLTAAETDIGSTSGAGGGNNFHDLIEGSNLGSNSATIADASASHSSLVNNFEYGRNFETHDLMIEEAAKIKSNSQLKHEDYNFQETPHLHKIRNIEFFKTNPNRFITAGDEGVVRIWDLLSNSAVQEKMMFDAHSDQASPSNLAVCPSAESLVAVYKHLPKLRLYSIYPEEEVSNRTRLVELRETPHKLGISEVSYMPWMNNANSVFVTSGTSDHRVVCWSVYDGDWKTMTQHEGHTNLVTGICGCLDSLRVISVGRDKKFWIFDISSEKLDEEFKMDAECVGLDANPVDSSLICIQTGIAGRQLRLKDLRDKAVEVATFGWAKESGNTTLVAPAWSPNGLLITAGSGEEVVKIFDIRYYDNQVPLSVEKTSHRGSVYRVAWAPTRSLLLSTGDRQIRLHQLSGGDLV